MRRVIGIAGRKRSGKDFLGTLLRESFEGVELRSFASRIYDYVGAARRGVGDLTGEILADAGRVGRPMREDRARELAVRCVKVVGEFEGADRDGKPRLPLQIIGTEIFRDTVSPSWWIDLAMAGPPPPPDGAVVLTDVRFANEAAVCGMVIRLLGGEGGDPHASERLDFHTDFVIDNSRREDPGRLLELASAVVLPRIPLRRRGAGEGEEAV